MAWIFLAESEESLRPWTDTSGQSPTAKTIDTPKAYSYPEWLAVSYHALPSGMTSQRCNLDSFHPSRLFTEDSLAKTLALQDAERVWKASEADYFSRSLAWLASYDRPSSSWKTCQLSVLEEATLSSGHWPASGMTVAGRLYPLQRWVLITSEKDGGYWPTPNVPNGGRVAPLEMSPSGVLPNGKKRQVGLEHQVRMVEKGLWPTPTTRDWKDGTAKSCENVPVNSLLGQAVHWPTPNCHKSGGSGTPKWKELELQRKGVKHRGTGSLIQKSVENAVCLASPQDEAIMRNGGTLNPTWVEWLMGYPTEWTVLEPWATQWFRSKRGRPLKG